MTARTTAVVDVAVGAVLGRFQVAGHLGCGGMGVVVSAVQVDGGRRVALKLLHGGLDESSFARFRREAMAAALLDHPNVVQVTEFHAPGEVPLRHPDGRAEPGPAFLVMELAEGVSLHRLLAREGRIDAARAIRIATQTLAGLGAAHAEGIVHRDIKPANILVLGPPGGEVVKICDFGLAKLERDTSFRTAAGAIVGTVAYMPPEQIAGRMVDARADLYALGVCIFEMLTGERPFTAPKEAELVMQILLWPPPDVRQHAPETPAHLAEVVARALDKLPEGRFDSAAAMTAALTSEVAAIGAPPGRQTEAPRAPEVPPLIAPPPRGQRRALLAAVIVVSATVGLVLAAAGFALSRSLVRPASADVDGGTTVVRPAR